MRHRLYLYVFNSLLFVLTNCRPTLPEPSSAGYNYFPLEAGRYVVYDVQEQRYTLTNPPVTLTYQIREVTGPAYTDVTGQTAYRLFRYRRQTNNQPWQADSVWSARVAGNEAIRNENGLDYIKLVFPVSDRLRWNGNRRNAIGEDEYETRNSGQPYRVFDKQFDQTVTVVGQNDSTLVSQDKRVEVYARQVGLVYKERVQLTFCSASPACIGQYQIDYGIRQFYRIRQYGRD